ncbi:MAG: hypothetical protein JWO09_2317 [Bacteroidetes bacterium]|nr:hypothetical protein [Bacteroidota bacterium]
MNKRIIYYCLLLFVLADIGYTFYQHLQVPLDGDISGGVIPTEVTNQILEDPFGFKVITQGAVYPNPNRFFAHWMFSGYFRTVPFIFQKIASPLDSIYLSAAFAKTIIQLLMIVLLARFITGNKNVAAKNYIMAMALVTPLFQSNGYRSYMGIIDHSITYTFFYALPACLLLIFCLPFFHRIFHKNISMSRALAAGLMLLAVILIFSGPLQPGIFLVLILLCGIFFIMKAGVLSQKNSPTGLLKALKQIPRTYLFFIVLTGALSLYSLYLGTHNSIFAGEDMPVTERYARLPEGLYYLVTQKIGFPVLLIMLIINFFLMKKQFATNEGKKIIALFKWIGLFSLLYIALLPLGGYKNYRPYILRYDTVMPVTIALILLYGISTYFLIKNYRRSWYLCPVIAVAIIFTLADQPQTGANQCEKNALNAIAQSKERIVLLNTDCTIMSWNKITQPENSAQNTQLLRFWGVLAEEKLYYQK